MSLKDLTQAKHTEAEATKFMAEIIGGTMSQDMYTKYLYQMMLVYNGLENIAHQFGMLQELPEARRTPSIYLDLIELAGADHKHAWLAETQEYYQYLLSLSRDPDAKKKLMAHIYVRHMGDLYGGQMIAKKVPGSGKFYKFENGAALKTAIRDKLDDAMGDEANVAFDYSIKIMRALYA
jgi:heme oxygenase